LKERLKPDTPIKNPSLEYRFPWPKAEEAAISIIKAAARNFFDVVMLLSDSMDMDLSSLVGVGIGCLGRRGF
jgi:hypothetical protein